VCLFVLENRVDPFCWLSSLIIDCTQETAAARKAGMTQS